MVAVQAAKSSDSRAIGGAERHTAGLSGGVPSVEKPGADPVRARDD